MITSFPVHHDHRRILPVVAGLLPDRAAQADSVVPIELTGDGIVVAALESCDDEALYRVQFICNRAIVGVAIVTAEAIAYALQRNAMTP